MRRRPVRAGAAASLTSFHELPTPALLLDLDRAERNIEEMAARARRWGVALRPHVKTHKCVELGRLQAAAGGRRITVSTLHEAAVFAEEGFDDITWAFPLVLTRVDECRRLARRTRLRLVVDSEPAVRALEAAGEAFDVLLKVDCGYHRAGVDPAGGEALRLAERLAASASLRFDGLLTHSGHAYAAGSAAAVRGVARQECRALAGLAERLRRRGVEVPTLSAGSTPALCRADRAEEVEALDGVTEIRPGNYVFFDRSQVVLGSCRPADCAVTVLASVVSSRPDLGHSVVDAGALALSKDSGPAGAQPPSWGETFDDYDAGRIGPALRLTSLSQEHGILSRALPVGERVRILPNHSCLTVACFDEYAVVRGEEVVDRWRVRRGR